MQITLTDLRRRPGPALDHVRSGHEIVVTEAGIPLCRIVPVDRPSRYAELVANGTIRPPLAPHDPDKIRAASIAGWPSVPE